MQNYKKKQKPVYTDSGISPLPRRECPWGAARCAAQGEGSCCGAEDFFVSLLSKHTKKTTMIDPDFTSRLRDFSCGLFFMFQLLGTAALYAKGRHHQLQHSAFYFMLYLLGISKACDQHHAGHGGATGPDAALPAHPHPRHEAPGGRPQPGALLGGAGGVHGERLARRVRRHPHCRPAPLGGHSDLWLCGREAFQPGAGGLLLGRRAPVAQVDMAVAALLLGTGRNVVYRHQGRQQRHCRHLQHGVLAHLCPAVLLCIPPGRHARGTRPRRERTLDQHRHPRAGGRAAGQLPLCPGPARHL